MKISHLARKNIPTINKNSYFILKNTSDRLFRSRQFVMAGKTPYALVYEDDLVSLRYYSPQVLEQQEGQFINQRHRIPLVIVPPLAANTLIFDLFPDRSLVHYLLNQGFDVYMIDWGIPTLKQTKFHMGTYIQTLMPELIQKVRDHSQQQMLSLYGWSLGGVFALTYTALFKDNNIRNLVIVGSPIDTHKSGHMGKVYQFLNRRAQWVRQNTNFRLRKIPSRFFHIAGWQNTLGFKMTDPIGSAKGYWEFIKNILDPDTVTNHATSSAFLDHMLAYPGGVTRDLILRFWIDNELAQGEMQFQNQTAKLSEIHSAILAIAGKSDTFVSVDALSPLLDLVSSTDSTLEIVPGGHMGIVSGSKAPEAIWPILSQWLAKRSD